MPLSDLVCGAVDESTSEGCQWTSSSCLHFSSELSSRLLAGNWKITILMLLRMKCHSVQFYNRHDAKLNEIASRNSGRRFTRSGNYTIFLSTPRLHHKCCWWTRYGRGETSDKEIRVKKRENWNDFSFVPERNIIYSWRNYSRNLHQLLLIHSLPSNDKSTRLHCRIQLTVEVNGKWFVQLLQVWEVKASRQASSHQDVKKGSAGTPPQSAESQVQILLWRGIARKGKRNSWINSA